LQTAYGKTVSGVAQLAKKYHVPAIALAAIVAEDLTTLYDQGISSVFAIGDHPMSSEESKAHAAELLAATSERIMRVITECKRI